MSLAHHSPANVLVTKDAILDMLRDMPDEFDPDLLMYRLYVLTKIAKAEASIEEHGLIPDEEIAREFDEWHE